MDITYVIQGLVVTEKAVQYPAAATHVVWVHPEATKTQIKEAFLELYGRKVRSVRLSRMPKKTRLVGRGREMTKRQEKVKAYIRFAEDKPFELLAVKGAKKEEVKVKKVTKKSEAPKKATEKKEEKSSDVS